MQREIDRKLAHNPAFKLEQPPRNNKRYRSAPKKSTVERLHLTTEMCESHRPGNDTCYDVLMDEIQEEFGGEETKTPEGSSSSSAEPLPIIYVCNRQFCPDCPGKILFQKLPHESCLSCPKCGVTTSYLDSTAASTGHSDDRSFNQFAYCRPTTSHSGSDACRVRRASPSLHYYFNHL